MIQQDVIYTIKQAQKSFDQLVEKARSGEEVIIRWHKGKMVQLVPIHPTNPTTPQTSGKSTDK